ncbi:13117_t:CDS:2 [Entrophospora sp. SA101]|nr:13117_t:CDS:2 [Entrophospora sp. SA101]
MTYNYQQQQNQEVNSQPIIQPVQHPSLQLQNLNQHIYQQNSAHQQIQNCGQYNQNNSDIMMMTNDHLPSSNYGNVNNEDDLLILRISHRI